MQAQTLNFSYKFKATQAVQKGGEYKMRRINKNEINTELWFHFWEYVSSFIANISILAVYIGILHKFAGVSFSWFTWCIMLIVCIPQLFLISYKMNHFKGISKNNVTFKFKNSNKVVAVLTIVTGIPILLSLYEIFTGQITK